MVASSPPHIFLFHGDDDYSTAQKVLTWQAAFIKKHSHMGVVKLDCETSEEWGKELDRALASQGLFSNTRLVLVKSAFTRKAEETEWLLERLENLDARTFLLFWEHTPVKKTLRLYKKIAESAKDGAGKIFEHTLPTGMELNRFLLKYASTRGYKLHAAAAEALAAALGRDLAEKSFQGKASAAGVYNLWRATNEIDKLATYAAGHEITPQAVGALVIEKTSDNIFLFTNALGAKQEKAARKYLNQLFTGSAGADIKTQALPIVGALAAQFRSLLLVAAAQRSVAPGQLAESLGWTPYRVSANLRVLKNFSESQIREMLARLLEIDRKIKSTPLSPKLLLGRLIQWI